MLMQFLLNHNTMRSKFYIILVTIQVLGYDPSKSEPLPSQPSPEQPVSELPPLLTETLPTEPLPTEPLPTASLPTKPLPTEPLPSEPLPTDRPVTEPLPTESLPAERPVTIPLPTEPLPAERPLPLKPSQLPATNSLPLPPVTTMLPTTPITIRPEKEPHTWFKGPVNQMTVDVLHVIEAFKSAEADHENSTDGIVTSQFATLFPLGELSLFVEGNSRRQLEHWLRSTRDDIDKYLPAFLDEIRTSQIGKIDLQVLSEVFIQKHMNVTDRFVDISTGKFGNDHAYVDFVYPEAAANTMNEFLSLSTEKKVSYVVLPQQISPGSQLIFVNVIFFKNIWKNEFNKSLSTECVFWRDTGSYKLVPCMRKTETMLYVESPELHAEVLTMPFDNEDFDFVIINPFEDERIGAVQRTIHILQGDPHILENVEKEQKMTIVELTMPKFKLHSNIDLKTVLNQLGVSQLFNEKLANIKGIFEGPQQRTFVCNLFQQAMVQIDEEGVVGDAGLDIDDIRFFRSMETKVVVEIRRPFIFMIRFRGVSMFMGIFDGMAQDSL